MDIMISSEVITIFIYALSGLLLFLTCFWSYASLILFILGIFSSAIFGISTYIILRIFSSSEEEFNSKFPMSLIMCREKILSVTDDVLKDPEEDLRPLFSSGIDTALKEIVKVVNKDFILRWFNSLLNKEDRIRTYIDQDLWNIIESLGKRLGTVDIYKFLIGDVLKIFSLHLERIRHSSTKADRHFGVNSYLGDKNKELLFLERLTEFLILENFPRLLRPVRSLIKEILSNHVIYPIIETLTDPTFLNQKVVSWIGQSRLKSSLKRRNLKYPDKLSIFKDDESYKRYIDFLIKSKDIEELKQARYKLLSEIIHATAMNNLTSDRYDNNFTKYINQLMNAKNICDKRLTELGGDEDENESASPLNKRLFWNSLLDGSNSLSFKAVMSSAFTRQYFYNFLKEENRENLLGFWSAVEELKESDKTLWHQLATEIFYTYIQGNHIRIKKPALRQMEEFLTGNTGPEIFYEIQENVYKELEQEYYHLFLVSDYCYSMIEDAYKSGITIDEKSNFSSQRLIKEITNTPTDKPIENGKKEPFTFSDHSTFARSDLSRIKEKYQNKSQALKALKNSLKPESKVLTMLREELEHLGSHKNDVEIHLSRTESWMERLGQWRSHCQSVRHLPDDSDEYEAVLIIYVPIKNASDISSSSGPTSWTLVRRGEEIQNFHKELMPYVPWVKDMEVPSTVKSFFSRQPNKASLEKTRSTIQRYMDRVLGDYKLKHSEAVYYFLSPSADYLKRPSQEKQQSLINRFKFPDFFRSNSNGTEDEKVDCNSTVSQLQLEHYHRTDDRRVEDNVHIEACQADKSLSSSIVVEDDVVDSFYNLICEVFDMRGVFKWLRKSLMTFVQITYGSTINRQLNETVTRLTSETMTIYYIRSLTKILTKGNFAPQKLTPCGEDFREEARDLLLLNIPEFLNSLVGQRSAKRGIIKVFETLQNQTLNKQLFFEILEAFINEMHPKLAHDMYSYKTAALNSF